jgi:hypothetical protein
MSRKVFNHVLKHLNGSFFVEGFAVFLCEILKEAVSMLSKGGVELFPKSVNESSAQCLEPNIDANQKCMISCDKPEKLIEVLIAKFWKFGFPIGVDVHGYSYP